MDTSQIPLSSILPDETYRISRPQNDDRLAVSIGRFGIISAPELLRGQAGYVVVKGHNRVQAAGSLGLETIRATVIESFDIADFYSHALLKEYQGEMGPVGKARLAGLFERHWPGSPAEISNLLLRGFSMPDLCREKGLADFILSLPVPVRDYCDSRDISFKVLDRLRSLPAEAVEGISRWVAQGSFRVNLFRSIVDMLDDIARRDGSVEFMNSMDTGDGAGLDSMIHEQVFARRFPEFSRIQNNVERLIKKYEASGIHVDVPKNREGSALRLTIEVDARDGIDAVMERVGILDKKSLEELLALMDQ